MEEREGASLRGRCYPTFFLSSFLSTLFKAVETAAAHVKKYIFREKAIETLPPHGGC